MRKPKTESDNLFRTGSPGYSRPSRPMQETRQYVRFVITCVTAGTDEQMWIIWETFRLSGCEKLPVNQESVGEFLKKANILDMARYTHPYD
jgi:hypothetical protein